MLKQQQRPLYKKMLAEGVYKVESYKVCKVRVKTDASHRSLLSCPSNNYIGYTYVILSELRYFTDFITFNFTNFTDLYRQNYSLKLKEKISFSAMSKDTRSHKIASDTLALVFCERGLPA